MHFTISNNFCNLVIAVKIIIIEAVGSGLTKVHPMTTNIKSPFFLKFSGAGVLFRAAPCWITSPIRSKNLISFYHVFSDLLSIHFLVDSFMV